MPRFAEKLRTRETRDPFQRWPLARAPRLLLVRTAKYDSKEKKCEDAERGSFSIERLGSNSNPRSSLRTLWTGPAWALPTCPPVPDTQGAPPRY